MAMVTPDQAAKILGKSIATLANWRWRGIGPIFHNPQRHVVYYSTDELEAWMRGNTKRSTSDPDKPVPFAAQRRESEPQTNEGTEATS